MIHWFRKNLIKIYMVLGFLYLFVPIIYTFIFSFNDYIKSNLVWRGFTLNNWKQPCGVLDICPALGNSIKIGLLATFVATILGTMIAFALGRYAFTGRGTCFATTGTCRPSPCCTCCRGTWPRPHTAAADTPSSPRSGRGSRQKDCCSRCDGLWSPDRLRIYTPNCRKWWSKCLYCVSPHF